jgi:hypothetical protein
MSKDRFNIWYNKWLGQIDEDADESLWNEIEDELDFRETWQNISGRLDKIDISVKPVTKKKSYLKEIIGIAAGILLVLGTAKYINDRSLEMPVSTAISLTGSLDQKVKTITGNALRQAGSGIMVTGLPGRRVRELLPAERDFGYQRTGQTRVTDGDRPASRTSLTASQQLTARPLDNKRPEMTLAINSGYLPSQYDLQDNISVSDGSRNLIGFKDAGLVLGYKNTWLLNHETFNGLNPSRLNSTLPTYRQEIGAATTMVLNRRTAFGIEFFWRSEIGQNYQQYINASYIDRKISLDYLKFQAFYLWDPVRGVPGEVLLGGYYSILKTGRETRGEDRFDIRQNYSDTDYGILLGYQLTINVQDRLVVKPGFRFNYNMRNIFEGDNFVPSHLKKTNSLSAGFNISVAYTIF